MFFFLAINGLLLLINVQDNLGTLCEGYLQIRGDACHKRNESLVAHHSIILEEAAQITTFTHPHTGMRCPLERLALAPCPCASDGTTEPFSANTAFRSRSPWCPGVSLVKLSAPTKKTRDRSGRPKQQHQKLQRARNAKMT